MPCLGPPIGERRCDLPLRGPILLRAFLRHVTDTGKPRNERRISSPKDRGRRRRSTYRASRCERKRPIILCLTCVSPRLSPTISRERGRFQKGKYEPIRTGSRDKLLII